jgi:hypothetical protein
VNRIAISAAAYAAIVGHDAGVELPRTTDGRIWVWLPRPVVDGLAAARSPRESFSDVILRFAAAAQPSTEGT